MNPILPNTLPLKCRDSHEELETLIPIFYLVLQRNSSNRGTRQMMCILTKNPIENMKHENRITTVFHRRVLPIFQMSMETINMHRSKLKISEKSSSGSRKAAFQMLRMGPRQISRPIRFRRLRRHKQLTTKYRRKRRRKIQLFNSQEIRSSWKRLRRRRRRGQEERNLDLK